MSNWKAGDRAVCVSDGWDEPFIPNFPCPKKGVTYLVTATRYSDTLYLCFEQFRDEEGMHGWNAVEFRKIVPACDRISQEQEGLIPHEGFFEGRPDL